VGVRYRYELVVLIGINRAAVEAVVSVVLNHDYTIKSFSVKAPSLAPLSLHPTAQSLNFFSLYPKTLFHEQI